MWLGTSILGQLSVVAIVTLWGTFVFHKRLWISCLIERLLASQGLWSVDITALRPRKCQTPTCAAVALQTVWLDYDVLITLLPVTHLMLIEILIVIWGKQNDWHWWWAKLEEGCLFRIDSKQISFIIYTLCSNTKVRPWWSWHVGK
jgi:hypothetical protein